VNLGRARALVGHSKVLQGNLDPAVLFAGAAAIEREAQQVLASFGTPHAGPGEGPTHIFNLGHGISQFTPADNVKVLVDAVHAHSRRMRANPNA
jgi:uroporphyrinogen decarboxylase